MSKSRKFIAAAVIACAFGAPAFAQQKTEIKTGPRYHIGRAPTVDEIRGWDIDVRPDGQGLPEGKGTVAQGEKLFMDNCSSCHGEFGEGSGRWPVLAGGKDSLTSDNPVKTVGSYWPYASTVFDYVRRSMPYNMPRSLPDDEVYALTAYILSLNKLIGENDVMDAKTLPQVKMPNRDNFIIPYPDRI